MAADANKLYDGYLRETFTLLADKARNRAARLPTRYPRPPI